MFSDYKKCPEFNNAIHEQRSEDFEAEISNWVYGFRRKVYIWEKALPTKLRT